MKRILIILVIVILLGVAGYFIARPYFSRVADQDDQIIDDPVAGGSENASGTAAFPAPRAITDQAILNYWLTSAGDVYYVIEQGTIFRMVPGQESEAVSSLRFENIQSIRAAADGTFAMIEFGQTGNTAFRIFNATSRSWRSLPDGVVTADWSPDGTQIAYLQKNPEGAERAASLYILTVSSGAAQNVAGLNLFDVKLRWTSPKTLSFIGTASGLVETPVIAFDLATRSFKELDMPEGAVDPVWAGAGDMGGVFDTRSGKTFWINKEGVLLTTNALDTVPEKCTLETAMIFCALPQQELDRSFFDDYRMKAIYTQDALVKIALPGGAQTTLWINNPLEPERAVDAWRLEASDSHLYFINRYDNKLYSLELPS